MFGYPDICRFAQESSGQLKHKGSAHTQKKNQLSSSAVRTEWLFFNFSFSLRDDLRDRISRKLEFVFCTHIMSPHFFLQFIFPYFIRQGECLFWRWFDHHPQYGQTRVFRASQSFCPGHLPETHTVAFHPESSVTVTVTVTGYSFQLQAHDVPSNVLPIAESVPAAVWSQESLHASLAKVYIPLPGLVTVAQSRSSLGYLSKPLNSLAGWRSRSRSRDICCHGFFLLLSHPMMITVTVTVTYYLWSLNTTVTTTSLHP